MYEFLYEIPGRLRWLILGILIVLATLIVSIFLLPAPVTNASADTSAPTSDTMSVYDSSNAVTNGMARAANQFIGAMASTGRLLDNGRRSVETSISRSGRYMTHGLHTDAANVSHGLASSAVFMARTVNSSMTFIFYGPRTLIGVVANATTVSTFIKPSENMPVPKIDPLLPATIAAPTVVPVAAAQPVSPATPATDSVTAWPLHGRITTLFGVPELPYQAIHTGLDISDGLPSGTTPIKPFKAGRVVEVSSYHGLGNHVVVDHGEGITSVYGHLYSIAVHDGQQVDTETILGFEGSTGVSTGTHLHFEIRVNGKPIDPHQFINGQP